MKYTVNRLLWFRGQGPSGSKLLLPDGTMCCLGHVGRQCGVTDEQMLNRGYPAGAIFGYGEYSPENIGASLAPFPEWFTPELDSISTNHPDVRRCAEINDDTTIDDAEREAKLKHIFALHGDELEFIN